MPQSPSNCPFQAGLNKKYTRAVGPDKFFSPLIGFVELGVWLEHISGDFVLDTRVICKSPVAFQGSAWHLWHQLVLDAPGAKTQIAVVIFCCKCLLPFLMAVSGCFRNLSGQEFHGERRGRIPALGKCSSCPSACQVCSCFSVPRA